MQELIILIPPGNRKPEHLARCLWSVAYRKGEAKAHVIFGGDFGIGADFASVLKITCLLNFTYTRALEYTYADRVYILDPSVIVWKGAFEALAGEAPTEDNFIVTAATYELWPPILEHLDIYGANLHEGMVKACEEFPLQTSLYHSDKLDFLAYCSRGAAKWLDGREGNAVTVRRTDKAISLIQGKPGQ